MLQHLQVIDKDWELEEKLPKVFLDKAKIYKNVPLIYRTGCETDIYEQHCQS